VLFFSVFARTDTNFPFSIYSIERSCGFRRAGMPSVLNVATNRIFLDKKLPVSVFRHPAGVVITLDRSFSGLDTILSSISSQILTGIISQLSFLLSGE